MKQSHTWAGLCIGIVFGVIIVGLLYTITAHAQEVAFDQNLYYGITNSTDVQALQEFLTVQGDYTGPITGNFFSLTLQGVKNFQEANGLPVTGYFGTLSRGVANSVVDIAQPTPPASEISSATSSPIFQSDSGGSTGGSGSNSIQPLCPVFTTPSGAVVDCNGNTIFTPTQTQTAQAQNEAQQVTITQQAVPEQEIQTVTPSCTLSLAMVNNNSVRLAWTSTSGAVSLTDPDYEGINPASAAQLATAPNAITVTAPWYLYPNGATTTTYTLNIPDASCTLTVSAPQQ